MKALSSDTQSNEECQWEHGWDEHERLQRQRLAHLPLADKLLWLEQAHRIVLQLQSGRRSDEGPSQRK